MDLLSSDYESDVYTGLGLAAQMIGFGPGSVDDWIRAW
jgi:hypothetical protein